MEKKSIHIIGKMLIMFTIMLVVGTVPVSAAEGDKSGKCGDNVTWTYTAQTKTLTIDGQGATYDYKPSGGNEYSPWVQGKFHKEIENIVVKSGITRLGTNFFSGCNVKNMVVPESVTSIGIAAFSTCDQMETIQFTTNVSLGAEVFQGCLSLRQIIGGGAIDGVLYADTVFGYSLEYYPPAKEGDTLEIPDGVVSIGAYALENQKYLNKIVIPQSVQRIFGSAIWKSQNPINVTFRGSLKKLTTFYYLSIISLPEGSTVTVRSQEDKDFLLKKIPNENFTVNIANVLATGLTLKDGSSTHETVVMEPGGAYTPTVKLAPYDTTDQVTWSYESTDSIKSFDSYTGAIELNGNGKAVLTGITGSGLIVTSEVFFYLPCDRNSLKIGYDDIDRWINYDDPDMAGTVLRIPLSGMINDFKTNYYAGTYMNTEPINAPGWRYSYAANRMSLESSNPEIIMLDAKDSITGCVTSKLIPKAVGTATIIVKADDGPNGFITRSFTVEVAEKNIHDCQIYNSKGDAYDVEKNWIMMGDKSELTIKDGGSVLTQGIDYQVSYENETSDSVCFRITGLGRYAGERLAYCQISKTSVNNGGGTQDLNTPGGNGGTTGNTVPEPAIIGVKDSYTKNYKDKPFTLKAKGKGKLTYSTSNKKVAVVGKTNGKVTLKEIGSVVITIKSSDAALKVKIQVVPKKPSIIKASASGKKAIRVTWSKDSKATGYQIQISADKKFAKGNKIITVKKNKTTSYTVKKLISKKKYNIRMRSYKTVSGKKYFSSWSSQKSVRTR